MKKLTYLIFTCVIALTCIFSAGCKVTLLSAHKKTQNSSDYREIFYPKGVGVKFPDIDLFKDAIQNGNEKGGYFVTLDIPFQSFPGSYCPFFEFNVNTNSKIKYGNSITQRGYFYDANFHEPKEIDPSDITFGGADYTLKYLYNCYELKTAPEKLIFKHYENQDIEGYENLIVIHDQNDNPIAHFAYKICTSYKIPTSEYMEDFITKRSNVIKGGITCHQDDIDKEYLLGGTLIDNYENVFINLGHLEEDVKKITEENKSCYAIIKNNKNSKYYLSDNEFYIFRKGEKYNVLNVNNYFEEKIQTETNGKIDITYKIPLYFAYTSCELKSEPLNLRYEHYLTSGDLNRTVLVYNEKNDLVLVFSYIYAPYEYSHYGIYCGDQFVEDLIKQNLVFINN